ncbi:MAG TPA: hypothetical protein VJ820_01510 [Propionibacteriaceae bacterium]|nr:hypothetical protein [Propionibacteriaceae bacterium]
MPANDRPTVGELLADGDAVSGEPFFEVSSSQRPAMGEVATPSATTTAAKPADLFA